jgi:ribonucleoside-diphosphate reductase alpha chain
MEFCNLSIVIARPWDTVETLKAKVRIATIFGTLQATLTDFNYLRDDWKKNCEEERLLGVDITGQMDCALLRPMRNPADQLCRDRLLQDLLKVATQTNKEISEHLGISCSVALTCVKPSGNSAQFFYCGSGIHTWYAKYFIRRVRSSIFDPVSKLLADEGVPYNVDPMNPSLWVFDFPMKAPEEALTRHDMTAIQMLENWLSWKRNWAEHSVSVTIYVEPHEWFAVGNWVYEHFDELSGLAFLPKSNANYQLPPYEEITQVTYQNLSANFPDINWSKLRRYETEDMTTSAQEPACVGGVCEL